MRISAERLAAAAEARGFWADMLVRVAQLLGLLDALQRHALLRGKLALKGGTAPKAVLGSHERQLHRRWVEGSSLSRRDTSGLCLLHAPSGGRRRTGGSRPWHLSCRSPTGHQQQPPRLLRVDPT